MLQVSPCGEQRISCGFSVVTMFDWIRESDRASTRSKTRVQAEVSAEGQSAGKEGLRWVQGSG